MKYIDSEKLIAEIERLYDEHSSKYEIDEAAIVLDKLEDFIASLQQEQPNKYETALEKARKWMPNVNQGGHAILIDIFPELGEGLDPRYGGRKQEQPEVDFEEEWDKFEDWMESYNRGDYPTCYSPKQIARHFYELGINARKEE